MSSPLSNCGHPGTWVREYGLMARAQDGTGFLEALSPSESRRADHVLLMCNCGHASLDPLYVVGAPEAA